MNSKKIVFFLFVLINIAILVSAQEGETETQLDWDNPRTLTTDDLLANPQEAQQNWNLLSSDQKNDLYVSEGGLQTFQDQFITTKQ